EPRQLQPWPSRPRDVRLERRYERFRQPASPHPLEPAVELPTLPFPRPACGVPLRSVAALPLPHASVPLRPPLPSPQLHVLLPRHAHWRAVPAPDDPARSNAHLRRSGSLLSRSSNSAFPACAPCSPRLVLEGLPP